MSKTVQLRSYQPVKPTPPDGNKQLKESEKEATDERESSVVPFRYVLL